MPKNPETNKGIRLTKLVDALKTDILKHHQRKSSEFKPFFKIQGATVEVNVEAKIEDTATGEFALWVAKAGGERTQEKGINFKITLNLQPVDDIEKEGDSPLLMGQQ